MTAFIEQYLPNASKIPQEFVTATNETLYMTFWSTVFVAIFGTILGIIMVVTGRNGILRNGFVYSVLDKIINIFRSIPFVILVAQIYPLTRIITRTIGTSAIGSTAACVPLVIGVTPFFARQVENALLEVDPGIVEAAQSMGSSPLGIIIRVYLKEGLHSFLRASSVTMINLIGLIAMAGVLGGGGLGNLAIARGYNRFQDDVTIVCLILILALVFIIQALFNVLIRLTDHGTDSKASH